MPYSASHTWVAGDFIRASWLNLDTTNLADHETRLLVEEAATTDHEGRITTLEASGGVDTLAELTDVALGSPLSDGDALVFNGTDWTNEAAAAGDLAGLTDVALTSPVSAGEVLTFDGTDWTNSDPDTVTWRGAWDSGTAYVTDDLVEHNGSSYIATSGSTNNEPGVGSPDPWDLVAQKGTDAGLIGEWMGPWDVSTAYAENDAVEHEGSSYIATEATTGDEPGVASPDPWELVAAKGDTGAAPTVLRTVGITIDGGGSVITTGVKGFIRVPFSGTITAAALMSTDASATSGSIVIDVWLDDFASFPPTVADTIAASAKPTLSADNASLDTTLTGWNTTVTAGDVFAFNVDSATTVTRVTLVLTVST